MANIYAISDIHGRMDLLKEIIEANVNLDSKDMLVTCGDYVDGDKNSNSYLTLTYLYELQKKYPQQVIVLKGNHDQWLSEWVLLDCDDYPNITTVQDFLTEEEFSRIFIDARRNSQNNLELTDYILKESKKLVYKKHRLLFKWVAQLPYYHETDNQIFVHAGIEEIEAEPELWKTASTEEQFLMKFSIEKGKFYKTVIAGHISTSQIVNDINFHDICKFNDHIYLDSSVNYTNRLNLLKFNTQTKRYTGIKKEDHDWIEYPIEERGQ